MAIRDIVMRGYGNGTFNPGVTKLPTRGYSIGTVAAVVPTAFWLLSARTTQWILPARTVQWLLPERTVQWRLPNR